jgi:predicted  nucleic acid-binding Zn-ribbon protein
LKEGKKELKNEKNNLKVIENEMKQVKNDLKNTENELNNTKNHLKITEHELTISKNNLKVSENEVKSLKNDLKSTENELKTVKTNLKSTEDDLKSLKNDLKSTEDELKTIKNNLKSTENELKTIKSLPKPEDLQKKIEILESQLKIHSSTASDIEVSQLKSVLQSQVLILDTECKRLEEKLKTSQSSKEKEVDSLTKKLDILSKQLAGLSLKNEELKRKIDDQENWKNEEFEVVKVVKFKLFSWFLIQTKPENRLIWTDQDIKTEVRDEFEELKIKYCKLKNYSFRLREEYKKILRKFQIFRKDFEFDKKFVPHDTNDEVLEITSPFISPRDTDMQLLYDGLKSARSYGTDFEDDTFGELSSKIVREGNSIFNASSFEEVNEDTDKINLMIEKMSGELQVKNEIIKNYEKTISELKSKVNNKE